MTSETTTAGRHPEGGTRSVRIGNASGFYGDRLSAMREMLTGGPLDVLTGDYLAELTMLILARQKAKDPDAGYARTFLSQLRENLGLALEKGVRLVANAGGMNPEGLARAIEAVAAEQGLSATVAWVDGDDLTEDADRHGWGSPLAANAYLGGFGIARALAEGADVVVTGRVTDAAVISGSATWFHGWGRDDLDALAGATVAGHIIECGAQATGGNFAFFTEIPRMTRPGFPLAEVASDGSCVITKHPGTDGAVTRETVTAQLLYEIQGARYAGPDVTTRLDTITLRDDGPDRVLVSGVRGEAPPPDLKVSINDIGGYINTLTYLLTGLDIEKKAAIAREQFEDALTVDPESITWNLVRTDHTDPAVQAMGVARLEVVARDPDRRKVGRAFSNAAVQTALSAYPGLHTGTPPSEGQVYGRFTAGYVPQDAVPHQVHLPDGRVLDIPPPTRTQPLAPVEGAEHVSPASAAETGGSRAAAAETKGADTSATATEAAQTTAANTAREDSGAGAGTVRVPLGRVLGARSGDKGGNANLGVWARDDAGWEWLSTFFTADRLRALLPELAGCDMTVLHLPALRSINVVVHGLLGEGVASKARFDPQAKALGEWLRSRWAEVPIALVPPEHLPPAHLPTEHLPHDAANTHSTDTDQETHS
ncbi:acyclic terpene utilization AtuA family protein [Brevibacterium yomogidense]|uniref:acyclic terpene utilization AtuA family protein n=1 Tax=Brevibacterium yomogidense TaxID=946573 RepID=UPI0018DFECB9|nr:acyclic terpene utilization AtuA family protein [Brevibacterium yomogidense]